MSKKSIYIWSVIIFVIAVAGISFNYVRKERDKEKIVYDLLPRKGASAQSAEWKNVQMKADGFMAALRNNPYDSNANIKLAALYLQEARETGNRIYYDKAAMSCINKILKNDSLNFNALVYKAVIYLSQHHFADGLAAAIKAKNVNPYNAYVYGLMVDSYVELGMYDSATANADRMVGIRPDLPSYSRVSYLREIFGSYSGAIEAMKMAVDAGGRGDEHTEWTRAQLGSLYEKIGDYKSAQSLYDMSLSMRPDYPYAVVGMAHIAQAQQDTKTAIALYEKADSLINDNSFKEELSDLYRAAGDNIKADAIVREVIEDLSKDAAAGDKDENIGHYADRELAYAYLKVKENDKALEHAMLEYNRRPNNIDVNETVAWVHYNRGEYDKALPYIKVALKTNSKNPVLLGRAGLIYFKNGDKQQAKLLLQQSLLPNTYIGNSLKSEVTGIGQML